RFDIGAFVREQCQHLDQTTLDRLEAGIRNAVHDPIDASEVLSYIGNIMASRISASRNLTGPSFTVSGDVTVGARALEVAALLLTDPTVEAVLVGAVDLAAGLENTLARVEQAQATGGPLPPLGDGAAAVVVTRATADSAVVVDGLGFGHGADATGQAVAAACGQAGTPPAEIEYVELTSGDAELPALAAAYGGEPHRCAVSGLAPLVGDVQRASFLVGLVRAAVALREATLPSAPPGLLDAPDQVLAGSSLFLSEAPQPWLRRDRGGRRVAAVSGVDRESAAHAVLSCATSGPRLAGDPDVLVVPVRANDPDTMGQRLRSLLDQLDAGVTGAAVMRDAVAEPAVDRYCAVLVAEDTAKLRTELAAAERDLPRILADGGDWATPAGSFCTGQPVGPGKVGFVYPGAFTSYPGMSRDLFRLFPELLTEFESEADSPATRYQHRALFPRSTSGMRRQDLMRHEAGMIDDIPMMLAAGTNTAVLYTRLLRDILGVRPDGGFGYSLGESSMLFALDVWAANTRDDRALTASPLFKDRLRGPKTLIRDTWRIPPDLPDRQVWQSRVVLAPADKVAAALAEYDRLYLTHVNTDTETVIAGDPAQLDQFAAATGFAMARAPANHVMHVELVEPARVDLAGLNDYPLGSPAPDLTLLSVYDYAPIPAETLRDRPTIATRNSYTLCRPVDFPRLVRTAHAAGFRAFVEVGPAATCTRWITEVLRADGLPHVAVSLDRRGAATATALAGALARLVSHGVQVRLEALMSPEPYRPQGLEVSCGGPSIVDRVRDAATAVLDTVELEPTQLEPTQPESTPPAPVEPAATVAEPVTPTPAPATIPAPAREPAPVQVSAPALATVAASALATSPIPTSPMSTGMPPAAEIAVPRTVTVNLVRAMAGTVSRAHQAALATQAVLAERMLATLPGTESPTIALDPATAQSTIITPTAITPTSTSAPAVTPPAPPPVPPPTTGNRYDRERPPGVRWDQADLLEFAGGDIGNVFGPEFAEIDGYPVRVRLPEPPYLFVTRVIKVDGTPGSFEPASIITEYDIPHDAWYLVDDLVPCAVTIEAGQCDLLLISYLGIDFRNRGERVYRLLDSTLVFHGPLPRAGQTLRYEINIDRFVWNGDALLFFFNYRCYADGELILELLNACAGFFSAPELENSLGVVTTDADRRRRAAWQPGRFKPLVRSDRTELSAADLALLAAGGRGEVFGKAYDQTADGVNRSIRLPNDMIRMIDEIPRIDRRGGPRGLGALTARKRLDPDGWYFHCHFKGDPVLAGSLVAEGGVQILQTYAMYLGLHLVFPDAEFQSVPGLTTSVKVRGQITPATPEIRYEVEVIDVTLLPRPTVIADITVYDGDKPIISMQNFGVQVREKPGTAYRPGPGGVPPFLGRRNLAGEPAFINELHLAHAAKGDLGTAMGPEFDVYANSRAPHIPNSEFQFVDRIMKLEGTRGQLKGGSRMVTEYDSPPEAWYYAQNSTATMPNCVLMETSLQAAILCGYYLGATLDAPDKQFSIRNLDGTASLVRDIDLRGKTIRHDSTMLFSSAAGDVLQKFRYELSADGEVFYRGESLFGYHTAASLGQQAGLDNGA
ncbi:MAG TPA: beta-ketoacyl synthase N-terminal-like domain-containing protein, partial [Micromonosporaceae bacterium]|nr:beta-ketoacyl synthase N-terminal-like domain-containing protein [Micromonosporaceae bacterium]